MLGAEAAAVGLLASVARIALDSARGPRASRSDPVLCRVWIGLVARGGGSLFGLPHR